MHVNHMKDVGGHMLSQSSHTTLRHVLDIAQNVVSCKSRNKHTTKFTLSPVKKKKRAVTQKRTPQMKLCSLYLGTRTVT